LWAAFVCYPVLEARPSALKPVYLFSLQQGAYPFTLSSAVEELRESFRTVWMLRMTFMRVLRLRYRLS